MAMQILRYGALALVSVCLVMIALVISGLVPLEAVRDTMAKVPALVQVSAEKPVEVAKLGDADAKTEDSSTAKATANSTAIKSDETSVPANDAATGTNAGKVDAVEGEVNEDDSEEQDRAETGDQIVPAFDVLRVEKDGSIVVAGRASPNSNIELRAGDGSLIGSGKTGASGDFVIVPDKSLAAGDYSLSLVVINDQGKESVSAETATISVPREQDGDVLAMVTKPGEASRIVAKPETLKADDSKNDETTAAPKEDYASVEQETAIVEPNTGQLEDTKEQPTLSEAADENTSNAENEQETAALDPQSGEDGQNKPASAADDGDEAAEANSSPTAIVRVEAVEIERDQIFIAGAANQGSTVRIYIDDKPVGEARGTSDNRFLVTRRFSLERGQHTVRADSIDNATGKVIARAEVPLLHEPVEEVVIAEAAPDKPSDDSVAIEDNAAKTDTEETEVAVAKLDGGTEPGSQDKSVAKTGNDNDFDEAAKQTLPSDPANTVDDGVVEEPKAPVAESEGDVSVADEKNGDEETPDVRVTKTESDLSGNDQQVALTKSEDVSSPNTGPNIGEQKAVKAPKTSNAGSPGVEKSDDGITGAEIVTKDAVDTTEETPAKPLEPTETEVVETRNVEPEDAGAKKQVEVAAAEMAPEIEGAPDGIIRTGTSVIIKPGDNLWRISRKTYGRGIRYTTIYEANKDQIRNPHWIYIGQIFKIPDRPDEELVEADG